MSECSAEKEYLPIDVATEELKERIEEKLGALGVADFYNVPDMYDAMYYALGDVVSKIMKLADKSNDKGEKKGLLLAAEAVQGHFGLPVDK